jgi:hypothetical protein
VRAVSLRGSGPPWPRAGTRAGLACAAALALAFANGRAARAAPPAPAPELTLTWQAPEDCPSAAEVQRQFVRLLGGPGRTPSPKHVEAVATVRRIALDTWAVRLETQVGGTPGQRTLEGDSCWAVASGAALILALTIDPAAASRAVVTPPEPPPPPPPPPVAVVAPQVVAPRRPTWRPFARVFSGVLVGPLPQAALLGGLAVGVGRAHLAAELAAWGTQQRRALAADAPGAGGDFRALAAAARGCGRFAGRPVGARFCLGLELERISGNGCGVDTPGSGRAMMLAGEAGAALTVPIGALFEASLGVDAAGRPYHPIFALDNVGRVFTVSAFSALAELGLTARF